MATRDDTIQILAERMTNRVITDEFRAKMSAVRSGKALGPSSEESKQKKSLALKNKPWSQARRDAHNKAKNAG